MSSTFYKNLAQATHLCLGAPVMLTVNFLWNVDTVPLGLMNGARGTVIAVLYKPAGAERTDGSTVATTGFPCGKRIAPLPDLVIVNFPSYTGPALFNNLPGTWVPVPCTETQHQVRKNFVRAAIPLRLCWALTVHKAQGLNLPGGAIAELNTSKPFRNPVASVGLAFVGWTRVTS
jgi:hypothetical protein